MTGKLENIDKEREVIWNIHGQMPAETRGLPMHIMACEQIPTTIIYLLHRKSNDAQSVHCWILIFMPPALTVKRITLG